MSVVIAHDETPLHRERTVAELDQIQKEAQHLKELASSLEVRLSVQFVLRCCSSCHWQILCVVC